MSHAKGVVLEKNNHKITVLTTDGAFQTLNYRGNVEIGEEIQLPQQKQVPRWRIGASIAAVFLLVFMGVFGWNVIQPRTAVAMISVDINPSLQLTLDQRGKVLELEALNSDAEQLLLGLSFKGRAWEETLNDIIKRSVAMQFLTEDQDWVLVGYSPLMSGQLPAKTINSGKITKQVQEAVLEQGLEPAVAVYQLTPAEKDQAQATGLTLGEYALVDTAQKAGLTVKPEAVKEKQERSRLLETQEIQEQMKKDKRVKKVNPKADKDKGRNGDEYELMGMDQYPENKNIQGKKDKQKPENSEGDKDRANKSGNDKGNDKSKDKVTDQKKKDDNENNSNSRDKKQDRENSNNQEKKPKNDNQNNDNRNNDNQNNQKNNVNDSKNSRSSKEKYNWDIREVLRFDFMQRG